MRRFASLRRRGEFARLRQRGRRTATEHLTIYREPAGPLDRSAAGISVPTSVGTAVVRNRVRRRLAACLHELLEGTSAQRILIIVRPGAASASYSGLHRELQAALG